MLILEEAAYCDEGFFYETVAPILSIGSASLVAISTLTSEINFYTRLIKMTDPATERPLFATRCIELCCEPCKEAGKTAECVHLLHLVPSWQSEERHRKLKIMVRRILSFHNIPVHHSKKTNIEYRIHIIISIIYFVVT